MLNDLDTIDVMSPFAPNGLVMVVWDLYPWPEADSEERFQQFQAKLGAYCRYVISNNFSTDHPNADRSKVLISVMSIVPASAKMRQTQTVHTPGDPSYEIPVRFDDVNTPVSATEALPKKKPWWKFW